MFCSRDSWMGSGSSRDSGIPGDIQGLWANMWFLVVLRGSHLLQAAPYQAAQSCRPTPVTPRVLHSPSLAPKALDEEVQIPSHPSPCHLQETAAFRVGLVPWNDVRGIRGRKRRFVEPTAGAGGGTCRLECLQLGLLFSWGRRNTAGWTALRMTTICMLNFTIWRLKAQRGQDPPADSQRIQSEPQFL